MKIRVTRRNWPSWLFLYGVVTWFAVLFTQALIPTSMAWLLIVLIFVGPGGVLVASAVWAVRLVKSAWAWATSDLDPTVNGRRKLMVAVGCVLAAPGLYTWFTIVMFLMGALNLDMQHRMH